MSRHQFVLVRSPFVGPATWAPVAKLLRAAGNDVLVPSLGRVDVWRSVVARCVEQLPSGRIVLAGHSGAGSLLPAIGHHADVRAHLFVDATLPPRSGTLPTSQRRLAELRALATDGLLPPWPEITGKETMAAIVPDDVTRRTIEDECPRLPVSYLEEPVPVPAGWDSAGAAYLQLSPLYKAMAQEAASRGYPVDEMDGGHLHMVVDPNAVADRMLKLVDRVG